MSSYLQQWQRVVSTQPDDYQRSLIARDASLNSFLEADVARREDGSSPSTADISGVPFAVKDNIAVRSFQLSCGSAILEGLTSPYDATVVSRLVSAGMVPVGKTNLDEFGMGSSTEQSVGGPTNNPWDTDRVAGGSSGGSAAAVAAGLVPVALGSDTGGSVRQPAALCGIYGLKPTYGTLSRYGLVAYASSLEVIGVLAQETSMIRSVYAAAAGVDPMDHTSVELPDGTRDTSGGPLAEAAPSAKADAVDTMRVAFLSGDLGLDSRTAAAYQQVREVVQDLGVQREEIELATAEYVVPAYYTIATAEASANLARFTGIRYGSRPIYAEDPEELVRKARAQGFGPEVKLRILLGTYVLRSGFQDQYYIRAQRIRTAIRNELDGLFAKYDLVILPVFPTAAFKHGETELDAFQQKLADRFTTLANLAAVPALAVPAGVHDGLPVGVQLMGPAFSEDRLLTFAETLATKIPLQRPPDYARTLAEDET